MVIALCLLALTIVQSWIKVFEILPEAIKEYIQERREAYRLSQAIALAEENHLRASHFETRVFELHEQRQETWEENQVLIEKVEELEIENQYLREENCDLTDAIRNFKDWKEEFEAEYK